MQQKKYKNKKSKFTLKEMGRVVGPGVVTGSSDDDPSGIGTYSVAGASFGLRQLWLAPYQLPLMIALQEMCGRLGLVTGRGLAGNIKKFLPIHFLYIIVGLLVFANVLNIGADISVMAASLEMVTHINSLIWAPLLTIFIILLEVFVTYKKYAGILKWTTLSLFAYVITAFLVPQDWRHIIISSIKPTLVFDRTFILTVVGFLGTTISPYLFFWQTSEENEEEKDSGKLSDIGSARPYITRKDIKRMRLDTIIGMILSQVICFFIIVTCASTLNAHGVTDISSAQEAASALVPFAGNWAGLLFVLGIVGSGLLGVPVLAGAVAYALSETFGWKEGLSKKFKEAKAFYITIIVATFLGLLFHYLHINPIKALLYAAVVNGVVAVPVIALIISLTSNKKVMGKYTNTIWSNVFGWAAFIIMLGAVGILIFVN
ncbi:MAG: divalent metal cation transporter [Patescibacteria group bacterium]